MFQAKVVEKFKTYFSYSITFFFDNLAVYEIVWENIVEPATPQMTIWCIRIVCIIPKAIKTHLEHVILIAFPPQQSYPGASQCKVVRILPVFIDMSTTFCHA